MSKWKNAEKRLKKFKKMIKIVRHFSPKKKPVSRPHEDWQGTHTDL